MAEATGEKFIGDMVGRIDPADPASLVFSIADYQVFDDELACVTWVYGGDGKQGIVLWNLEPGQENDYHQHPTTEHLHVMIEGTAEYTLDGGSADHGDHRAGGDGAGGRAARHPQPDRLPLHLHGHHQSGRVREGPGRTGLTAGGPRHAGDRHGGFGGPGWVPPTLLD